MLNSYVIINNIKYVKKINLVKTYVTNIWYNKKKSIIVLGGYNSQYTLKNSTGLRLKQAIEIVANEKRSKLKITYILYSLIYKSHQKTYVWLEEKKKINSNSILYKSVSWLERDIWDLFGIKFKNNYDLRRLTTDYGFNYHALRKGFPLSGFEEIKYNVATKNIVHMPISLVQQYRVFLLENTLKS